METYRFPHFPPEYGTIHIAAFENVTNSGQIRERLIRVSKIEGEEGDKEREKMDFGFVEGKMLVSKLHLLTALQTTLISSLQPPLPSASFSSSSPPISSPGPTLKLRSHNLHSEFLLYLSPSNNITDSIRRHGLSDETTNLVVVKFSDISSSQEEIWKGIERVVQGKLVSLGSIEGWTDWGRVDKIYKLNEMNNLKIPDLIQKKITAVINTVAIKTVA